MSERFEVNVGHDSIAQHEVKRGIELYECFNRPEFFDNRFCGFETIDDMFRLPDGTKLLEVNDEMREHAFRSLAQKFHEGDIGLWWDRIQIGDPDHGGLPKCELDQWMLFYRPEALMRTSLTDPKQRGPISLASLMSVVDAGRQQQGHSTRFVRYLWESLQNESWLKNPITPGWNLVTQFAVASSASQNLEAQNAAVRDMPEDRYFLREHRVPRTPVDIVFDCANAQESGVPHLLEYSVGFERTQQKTDRERIVDGRSVAVRHPWEIVNVGHSLPHGMRVQGSLARSASTGVGACLSR